MPFKKVDQDAGAENRPLSAGVAQTLAENANEAREVRGRSGSVSFPQLTLFGMVGGSPMCGAFSLSGDSSLQWQAFPFLWRSHDPTVSSEQIIIDQDHQTDGVEMRWGVAAGSLRSFPSPPSQPTDVLANSVAGVGKIGLVCDVSAVNDGGYYIIWLFVQSDVGDVVTTINAAFIDDAYYNQVNLDPTQVAFTNTDAPFWVATFEGTVDGVKRSWQENSSVPSPRQIIRHCKDTAAPPRADILYLWPPLPFGLGDSDIEPGTWGLTINQLAWAKVLSVSITDGPASIQEPNAAYNAGQPNATIPFRQIYADAARVFLSHTKSHAIGASPMVTELDLSVTGGPDAYVDRISAHGQLDDTDWRPIGSTMVSDHDVYKDLSGAGDLTRSRVRVTAYIGFTGPLQAGTVPGGETTRLESCEFRLRLFDPIGGGSEVIVGPTALQTTEMLFRASAKVDPSWSNPAAILLGYPWFIDGTDATIIRKHALRGGLPLDVWPYVTPFRFQADIETNSSELRVLNLEFRDESARDWAQFIHLHMLCWHVEEAPSRTAESVVGFA